MKKLFTGAEAVIYEKDGSIVKERIKKGYRIPAIDSLLRSRRTASEARLLREARRNGVNVPSLAEEGRYSLTLERINGEKLKDRELTPDLAKSVGESMGRLHAAGIIHGDLTTSNMLLAGEKLYIIDFGLAFFSQRDEDKANDLYLLRENLKALGREKAWPDIERGYHARYEGAMKAIKTLLKIEKRRRYSKGE
ncbi:MAG: Kae1-associated serine/threonine protein kinase [Candidatus Aenigmarchaeota archaeon]|nr:Kae1-associated serine/threonine protein kinase [Candidatus Aenigmarchaeota archaeon]